MTKLDRSGRRHEPNAGDDVLGVRLRSARIARGMSTRRLGLWLGRANAMVSRWEGGQREPTLHDLDRTCAVLRLDLDLLLADLPPSGPGRRAASRAQSWSHRRAVGDVLADMRVEAGLDRWSVFLLTDIDTTRLKRIETGSDPSIDEIVALLRVYATTPRVLVQAAKARRRAYLERGIQSQPHALTGPDEDGA